MLTIFTPTYNRCHLIDNLYQSLLAQDNQSFEWLVIDDGSTDDTEAYFQNLLKQQQPFEIRCVRQPNGGKHRAINKGVSLAQGELFFIVDSDDYLTPDAVSKVYQWNDSLDSSKKWAGFAGLRSHKDFSVIGKRNTNHFIDAKNNERENFCLIGDKAEVYFTNVLKKYPFPEFEGEKFISEEVVWNAIARDDYYLRWFNEIIYICEYLEGGSTMNSNSLFEQNPQGTLHWVKSCFKSYPHNFRRRWRAIHTYYTAVRKRKSLHDIAKDLELSYSKTFLISHFVDFFTKSYMFLKRKSK